MTPDVPATPRPVTPDRTGPGLRRLFEARSVAVVGASEDPRRIGGRPIAYMQAMGYAGTLYPVNPNRAQVQGLTAYPGLASLPGPVDLVVIATPAEAVEPTLAEAARIGAQGAVVFSSGFSEAGAEGAARQRRLADIADKAGMALLGPNCLGLFDAGSGVAASFTTALEGSAVAPGALACVSQSGAMAAYWLDMVRSAGLGVSRWITTGNEAGIDIAAALEFLAADSRTRAVCLYVEDIKDGPRFRAAALAARAAGKAVIAIKAGRSAAGVQAAASHTGAVAGEPAVYDAFLRQFGVILTHSLTEMVQVAALCLNGQVPNGDRLGIMSVSGGAGVMLADEAATAGFALPPLAAGTATALAAVLPGFATAQNPIDLTGSVIQTPALFARALAVAAAAPEIDALVLFIGLMHSIADPLAAGMEALPPEIARRVVVIWMGIPPATLSRLTTAGFTVFPDIPEAIGCLAAARAPLRSPLAGRPALSATPAPASPPEQIGEHPAKALVARLGGLALPPGLLIPPGGTLPDSLPPGPWAAKLQSPEMAHKTEHGALRLGLADRPALAAAVSDLAALADRLNLPSEGVLVETMTPGVAELLLGLRRDPRFGPYLVVGRGGTAVELEPDTAIAFLPVTAAEIRALIDTLRCAPLLHGFRGRPAADLDAAATAIATLADSFATHPEIAEIEVNPLALQPDGAPVALDALAWLHPA